MTAKKNDGEAVGIDRLLGYAIGVLGMSYEDFCRCTPSQYQEAIASRRKRDEEAMHERWEMARWAACAVIQPHIQGRANPKEIMPLPWDDTPGRPKIAATAPLDRDTQLDRFTELMKAKKGVMNFDDHPDLQEDPKPPKVQSLMQPTLRE